MYSHTETQEAPSGYRPELKSNGTNSERLNVNFEGSTIVTLGDPYTKRTISMVTAFIRFPDKKIIGAETYEEGASMVLDPEQDADGLLICCLYPKTSQIWRDMKMVRLFDQMSAPFIYGQFGVGDPYLIAVHPAAERFAKNCPKPTRYEYVNSNERAPEQAKRLYEEFDRPIGWICPDFVGSHFAPDNVVKQISEADPLPFALLVGR